MSYCEMFDVGFDHGENDCCTFGDLMCLLIGGGFFYFLFFSSIS